MSMFSRPKKAADSLVFRVENSVPRFEKSYPNPFADKVKCDECRCWLDKNDAHKVNMYHFIGHTELYFCGAHRKPYNEKVHNGIDGIQYFGRMRMNEDGTPYTGKKKK